MYAVVGCRECAALWIVEGRPETTRCPRCRRRHQFARLKSFVETDDEDEARDARATMLAERSGGKEAVDALDAFETMEARAERAGPSEEEYLAGSGIDPEEVAAVDETPERDTASSRRGIVIEGVERLEKPTRSDVIGYAADRGVPEAYTEEVLAKLRRAGRISENDGRYRLL